jgi:Protein of unknown function (DUF3016)
MKTRSLLPLVAGLALAAGFVPCSSAAEKKVSDNITVTFQDPDNFTDVRDNRSAGTSLALLDELRDSLVKTAASLIPADQKLTVTFTDVDLAGDVNLSKFQDTRIVTDVTLPRLKLNFQLVGADGKVIREGKRSLTDMNFMSNLSLSERNQPLFYDKALLKKWVKDEFPRKA